MINFNNMFRRKKQEKRSAALTVTQAKRFISELISEICSDPEIVALPHSLHG